MLDSESVKQMARRLGADAVGIGSLDRFDGAPKEMDPRYIAPRAKSMIGMLFRIPRGYLRGLEEGTHFFQYPSMGYAAINEFEAPSVLYNLGRFIESHGHEACVFRNTGGRGSVSDMTGKPGRDESPELHRVSANGTRSSPNQRHLSARTMAPGVPPPDVFIHYRIGAFICGLGEIGYSKMFLSPHFGPLNRQAFILTDAELEPDQLYEGPELCNGCMACVAACPGKCLSRDKQISVTVAGRVLRWGELDEWKCFAYYIGANKAGNPFLPRNAFDGIPDGERLMRGEKASVTPSEYPAINEAVNRHYPNEVNGYNPPKCGGCLRACLNSMESRGVLVPAFHNRFRDASAWKLEV